jgi:hypothetical protein
VGELHWKHWQLEFTDADAIQARIEQLAEDLPELTRIVLRITLRGSGSPAEIADLDAALRARFSTCPILEICDETLPEFTSTELEILRAERYRGVGHVLTPEWAGRDRSS